MKGGIVHMRNIKQLESFDISRNHIINSKFIFNNKQYIDYEWLESQIQYINNLSDRQKHIIRAYTIYGDKFINNYLRKTLTPQLIHQLIRDCIQNNENPFLYQHRDFNPANPNIIDRQTEPILDRTGAIDNVYKINIITYIKQFIEEFNTIIKNAPRLTKQIKVFRGLQNGDFIVNALKKDKDDKQYMINSDYMSTSIYVASASNFMKDDCCLLELQIEPNTPCLFTAHMSRRRNEYEITFMPGMTMRYVKCTRKYLLDDINHYDDYKIFLQPRENDVRIVRMCEFIVNRTECGRG